MDRNQLKDFFKEFKLLTTNNKLNHHKFKKIPKNIEQYIFNETTNCISNNLLDRIYWILNDLYDYPICNSCKSKIIKNIKSLKSSLANQKHCSPGCRFKDPLIKARIILTNLDKYNTINPTTIIEIKEKRKKTYIKKYGVDNPIKVEKFKEKRKQTNLKFYGIEYPSHTEKGIKTNLLKYGVRHPMQNPTIFKKMLRSRFKIKEFITKTGLKFNYQGYEDVGLKFLLEELKIPENKIFNIKNNLPIIWYLNPKNNKLSRYYPDLWIPDLNLLIEIKSEFTMKLDLDVNIKKHEICNKYGFNHIILICTHNKIVKTIK